ncbi:hypothetical protein COB55_03960 [Candidatus Wolfebacteria bacterium]|nr:MAG: hypothetical protein COB55_03960 [Candidatus Wolfebacteria bacterium]
MNLSEFIHYLRKIKPQWGLHDHHWVWMNSKEILIKNHQFHMNTSNGLIMDISQITEWDDKKYTLSKLKKYMKEFIYHHKKKCNVHEKFDIIFNIKRDNYFK